MKYRRYLRCSLKQLLLFTGFLIPAFLFAIAGAIPLPLDYFSKSYNTFLPLEFAFLFLCVIGVALAIFTPFWVARNKNELRDLHFSHKKQFVTYFIHLCIAVGIWAAAYLLIYLLVAAFLTPIMIGRGTDIYWFSHQTPFLQCFMISIAAMLLYVAIALLISMLTRQKVLAIALNISFLIFSFSAASRLYRMSFIPEGTNVAPGSPLDRRLQLIRFLRHINPGSIATELAGRASSAYYSPFKMTYRPLLAAFLLFGIGIAICAVQDHIAKRKKS